MLFTIVVHCVDDTKVFFSLCDILVLSAADDEEDERSDEAWIYRWLIAALCLLAVVVIVILVVVVMATRHRRRARGRRFDNDVEMKRRQEKYFNTLRTTNDGYYNWTYDPTDVYST